MERAEKVIALYKYIKELCALKYRVVTDVEKQYCVWANLRSPKADGLA